MKKIEKKGFIPSHRTEDTYFSKTLEDELGVEENSVQTTDLDEVELKVTRKGSNEKIHAFYKSS